MINNDLFYVLKSKSPDNKPPRKSRRLVAIQKEIAALFLANGYAAEFYSFEGKPRQMSWIWGPGEFIIPTSPYSTVIMLEDAECIKTSYGDMISLLKNNDDLRVNYKKQRELHNIAIAERIKEINTKTPLEVYVNLLSKKPWVLEQVSDEDFASYLHVDVKTLKGFRNMKA